MDRIVTKIRHSFPHKFQIFPSVHSIGAYWLTDDVSEEFATTIIQRIIQNCTKE
jgi:hypothetical protein